MAQFLEAMMLILFGLSWPTSIVKSVRARTAKGKSLLFLLLVLVGYAFGIAAKFVSGSVTYLVFIYILNFLMVLTDVMLYFRNRRLDKLAGN